MPRPDGDFSAWANHYYAAVKKWWDAQGLDPTDLKPLEDALAETAGLDRLEPRDRAFARMLVATVLRRLGQIDAIVTAIIRDLTEEKERERLINEQRVSMIESERLFALGVMAGGIAHEVNNPVTVIQALARKIKREVAPWSEGGKCVELAANIESTALRIGKIETNDILVAVKC